MFPADDFSVFITIMMIHSYLPLSVKQFALLFY